MTKLEDVRLEINEIDSELVSLFERRMHAVAEVARYKQENHLAVLDSSREEDNCRRNAAKLDDAALAPYFDDWYRHTMAVSRDYQKDLLNKKED